MTLHQVTLSEPRPRQHDGGSDFRTNRTHSSPHRHQK